MLMAKLRRLERGGDGGDDHSDHRWTEAETWETESCGEGEAVQREDEGELLAASTVRRSEVDEWEEELRMDIETEYNELGQIPPEDYEDWADD